MAGVGAAFTGSGCAGGRGNAFIFSRRASADALGRTFSPRSRRVAVTAGGTRVGARGASTVTSRTAVSTCGASPAPSTGARPTCHRTGRGTVGWTPVCPSLPTATRSGYGDPARAAIRRGSGRRIRSAHATTGKAAGEASSRPRASTGTWWVSTGVAGRQAGAWG